MADIDRLIEIVDTQFDGCETFGVSRLDLLDPLLRALDLAGRGVEADRARRAAEELVDRLAFDLALDVPERGLDPPVAPTQIGDLAQTLLDEPDVGGVLAEEIRPEHIAETRSFAAYCRTGTVAFNPVFGGDPDQSETVLVGRHARDPGGPEGGGRRDGDVEQLDLRNATACGGHSWTIAPRGENSQF